MSWISDIFKSGPPTPPDPAKFKLRIVPAWFSSDYVSFEYTTGGSWKKIMWCDSPLYFDESENYTWDEVSYKISGNHDFKHEKERWSTYEKIKQFEEEQYQRMVDGNKSLNAQRKAIRDRKAQFYNNINND